MLILLYIDNVKDHMCMEFFARSSPLDSLFIITYLGSSFAYFVKVRY